MSTGGLAELAANCCAPAGAGWAASSSGYALLAAALHQDLYGATGQAAVASAYRSQVAQALADTRPLLVGVPYAAGAYGPNSSQAGPLGIRLAGRTTRGGSEAPLAHDLGDVRYFPGLGFDAELAPDLVQRAKRARGIEGRPLPVAMLSVARAIAREARALDRVLVTLGGDHSVSAATAGAYVGAGVGLIYFDQHPDLSTGRDGLSTLHSSWVTRVVEECRPPVVVHIGGSESAPPPQWDGTEFAAIDRDAVRADPPAAAAGVVSVLRAAGCSAAYLSFDIDVLDRTVAPATGLPAADGLLPAEVAQLLRLATAGIRIVGTDIMEVGPRVTDGRVDVDITCRTAAALLTHLLERIQR